MTLLKDALGHELTEDRFAQTVLAATSFPSTRRPYDYQVRVTGKIEPLGGGSGSGSDSYNFTATISAGPSTRMITFRNPYQDSFLVFRDEKLDVSEQINSRLASIRGKTAELAMLKGLDVSITTEEGSFNVRPQD